MLFNIRLVWRGADGAELDRAEVMTADPQPTLGAAIRALPGMQSWVVAHGDTLHLTVTTGGLPVGRRP